MKIWPGKEQRIAGFLDQGTNLTGELQFSGTVRIDGNFHGSIGSGDTLIVGENAVIHADIRVREIEIHGQVFGNIEVGSRAEIHASGRLRGDLRTPVLVIHAGGVLDGRTQMITDSSVSSASQFRESTRIVPKELKELEERPRGMDRTAGQ